MTADTTSLMRQHLLQHGSEQQLKHNRYLSQFRVKQCADFASGGVTGCKLHKPFSCFHWHFKAQRRRKVTLEKDGNFTYSPHIYCLKYSLDSGHCPDGDSCRFLHHNAGDTERKFHPRFYKTSICCYEMVKASSSASSSSSDGRFVCRLERDRGHCPYAHTPAELRSPVVDMREEGEVADSQMPDSSFPSALDKERNEANENPKWIERDYILKNYKSQPCKRPNMGGSGGGGGRSCRQGFACPLYHNAKDRRRCPFTFSYRNTPCPNVKQGDDWRDPNECAEGDKCAYCHTRVEQQFHPDIYKTTKCHDYQQTGRCPRGVYCAFSHQENTGASISVSAESRIKGSTSVPEIKDQNNNNNSSISASSSGSNAAGVFSRRDNVQSGISPLASNPNADHQQSFAQQKGWSDIVNSSSSSKKPRSKTESGIDFSSMTRTSAGEGVNLTGGSNRSKRSSSSSFDLEYATPESSKTMLGSMRNECAILPKEELRSRSNSKDLGSSGLMGMSTDVFQSFSPGGRVTSTTAAIQPRRPTGSNPWFGHALFASSRSTPSPPTVPGGGGGVGVPIVSASVASSRKGGAGVEGSTCSPPPQMGGASNFNIYNNNSADQLAFVGSPLFYDSPLLGGNVSAMAGGVAVDLFGEKSSSIDLEDSFDGSGCRSGSSALGGGVVTPSAPHPNSHNVATAGMPPSLVEGSNHHPVSAMSTGVLGGGGTLAGGVSSGWGSNASSSSHHQFMQTSTASGASGDFMGPMGMVNAKATQPVNIPRLSTFNDPESRVFRANFYPFSQDDPAFGGNYSNLNRSSFTYGLLSSPSSQSPLSHPSSFDGNSTSREDLRDTNSHVMALAAHTGGTLRFDPSGMSSSCAGGASGLGLQVNTSRLSYPPSAASAVLLSPGGSNSAASSQQLLLPIPETEMETLSLDQLQEMKEILSYDIKKIEEVMTRRQEILCVKCRRCERSVALQPCNCMLVCEACAIDLIECPKCKSTVNEYSKLIISTQSV